MAADDAVRLAVEALYDAADDDTATGGPDLIRKHLPGGHDRHRRGHPPAAPTSETAAIAEAVVAGPHGEPGRLSPAAPPQPVTRDVKENADRGHAVLRLARADHARPLGVRPQGHRPRPQRRRAHATRAACCSSPRTSPPRCTRSARSTTGSGSPRSAGTTSSRTCARAGVRLADLRGYSYDRRDVTGRALANAYAQTLGAIFTEQPKPFEVEICVAEVGAHAGRRRAVPADLRRLGAGRAGLHGDGRPGRGDRRRRCKAGTTADMTPGRRRCGWRSRRWPASAARAAQPRDDRRQPARGGGARPARKRPHVPPHRRRGADRAARRRAKAARGRPRRRRRDVRRRRGGAGRPATPSRPVPAPTSPPRRPARADLE